MFTESTSPGPEAGGRDAPSTETSTDAAQAEASPRQVRVRFSPAEDVEIAHATGMVVNFSGDEFLVSIFQVRPPVFIGPEQIPEEMVAQVIFRATMSPSRWIDLLKSLNDQMDQLRAQGLMPSPDPKEGNEQP
jgi:hypothetical protein